MCESTGIESNFAIKMKIKRLSPNEAEDEEFILSEEKPFNIERDESIDSNLLELKTRYEALFNICTDLDFLNGKYK